MHIVGSTERFNVKPQNRTLWTGAILFRNRYHHESKKIRVSQLKKIHERKNWNATISERTSTIVCIVNKKETNNRGSTKMIAKKQFVFWHSGARKK